MLISKQTRQLLPLTACKPLILEDNVHYFDVICLTADNKQIRVSIGVFLCQNHNISIFSVFLLIQ